LDWNPKIKNKRKNIVIDLGQFGSEVMEVEGNALKNFSFEHFCL